MWGSWLCAAKTEGVEAALTPKTLTFVDIYQHSPSAKTPSFVIILLLQYSIQYQT
jgi:hypothetical protein